MPAHRRFCTLTGTVRANNSEHSNADLAVAAWLVRYYRPQNTECTTRAQISGDNIQQRWDRNGTLKHRTVSAKGCCQEPALQYIYAHHHEAQDSPAAEADSRPPSHDFPGIYEPDCSLTCLQKSACGTEPHLQ